MQTPTPLAEARAVLVNTAQGTPPAAIQLAWERAKAARGQSVHFDRLEPLARALAKADGIPLTPCNRVIEHRIAITADDHGLTTTEAADRIARKLEALGLLFRPFDHQRVTIALHGANARSDSLGGALCAWVTTHLRDAP